MTNKRYMRGYFLIVTLVVLSFSAVLLSYLYSTYLENNTYSNAKLFKNSIIQLRDKITEATIHEENCSLINNQFIIENGLLPSGFQVRNTSNSTINSKSSKAPVPAPEPPDLEENTIIEFNYGQIEVGNVTSGGLPSGIESTDTFYITLSNYKFTEVPLFVEPLLKEFDRVRIFTRVIASQGESEKLWDDIIKYNGNLFDGQGSGNQSEKVEISFEMWDC